MAHHKNSEKNNSVVKKISQSPAKKKQQKKSSPAQRQAARNFEEIDQIVLSQNEYFRFAPNPAKVAHALIWKKPDAKKQQLVADQYPAPVAEESDRQLPIPDDMAPPPLIRPLENIEQIERYGQTRFRAATPNGTEMFATRLQPMIIDKTPATLAFFSPLPPKAKGNEPFWGSEKEVPFFKPDLSADDKKACIAEEVCTTLEDDVHKRQEVDIDYDSVIGREGEKRSMSQNQVMGDISARDAFEEFYDNHSDVMSEELATIFKQSYQAPLRDAWGSQKRPEWLHLKAHGLTPKNQDPQVPENLGAAPKWANTRMMIPERTARWYAHQRPDSQTHLKADFTMLHGTDLAKKIDFEVTFTENGKSVQMKQEINPLAHYPIYSAGSDIAQATLVTHSIHQGVKPSTQPVKVAAEAMAKPAAAAQKAQKADYYARVFGQAKKAYRHGPSKAEWKASLPAAHDATFSHRGRLKVPEGIADFDSALLAHKPSLLHHYEAAKARRAHSAPYRKPTRIVTLETTDRDAQMSKLGGFRLKW